MPNTQIILNFDLGTGQGTKTDEFSEKYQKNLLQILDLLKVFFRTSQRNCNTNFGNWGGGGQRPFRTFPKNSSVLGPWPVPYWNSRKGRGSNHPSCEFFSSEWILWLGLWTPSYWSLCKIFHQHRDLKSATIKCESLSIHVCAGMMIEFALGTPHVIKPCWVFLFVKTSSPAHDIIWYLGSSA